VEISGEFIGVLFADDKDGERSYRFNMGIVPIDLDNRLTGCTPAEIRLRSFSCRRHPAIILSVRRDGRPVGQPIRGKRKVRVARRRAALQAMALSLAAAAVGTARETVRRGCVIE